MLKKKLKFYTKEILKFFNITMIALRIIMPIILIKYKPMYKVSISGEELGYIENKQALEETLKEEITECSDKTIEDDYLNKSELLDVCKKIHKMDEKSKEVIYLRIFTNFSFKEIADIIGKTENYARTIFFRAKNKLKEDFNE